tara:strand:+ start:144 stop:338 length:195 start_codon:yes stop_codon:yes gene_type:complete
MVDPGSAHSPRSHPSSNSSAFFDHHHVMPGFGKLVGAYATGNSGAYNEDLHRITFIGFKNNSID